MVSKKTLRRARKLLGNDWLTRLQRAYSVYPRYSVGSADSIDDNLFIRFCELALEWESPDFLSNFIQHRMLNEDNTIAIANVPKIAKLRGDLGSYCIKWCILPNLTLILVKYIAERENTWEEDLSKWNNLIVPEIARFFRIESAQYYLAKARDGDFIITPSFLGTDEELIHFGDIVRDSENSNKKEITVVLACIAQYLRTRFFSGVDIDRVKLDFIKQSIFGRFILYRDSNNRNSGIIIGGKDKTVRIAPIYDLDFSCEHISWRSGKNHRREN